MSAHPKIWLLDDGELFEIRCLLNDADILFGEGQPPPDVHVQLLITSARRALLDPEKRPRADVHLVLFEESSRGLRKVLERTGCDLVMALPITAQAFHLILRHRLYDGPEKRRSRRVMLSAPVKIKRGLHWGSATLISLSLRGCGIVTDSELRVGREQEVKLPASLTRASDIRLNGRVLSSRPAQGGGFETAMAFRLIDPGDRRVLVRVLEGGGAELKPRAAKTEPPPAIGLGGSVEEPDPGASGEDRRQGNRKRFTRRVLAAGAGISHVLIGRDLSAGGMRVRPDADLAIGDVLKLAIHGHPGQPAIMVKATVLRDDGEDGMVLRFEELPASIAGRLEEMVARLPSLPHGGPRTGNVVGEVLGRD
ncbi:MAG: PilZ domain-containing protein [Myxococcota bacterium]